MNEKAELATEEYRGDTFVAVQEGSTTHIYGPDGDKLISFYANIGSAIDALVLGLIVRAYYRGLGVGITNGDAMARADIRQALGL